MERSDVQETLVALYLRLNGYFVSGFIVHAKDRTGTEMDVLAVRYPKHQEPEREVECCRHLLIPTNHVDFIVGEVKGGQGAVNFNVRFRSNPDSIRAVLHRFGAFENPEVERITTAVPTLLDPTKLLNSECFPELDVATSPSPGVIAPAKLRFVPFAVEQNRPKNRTRPYVFADDLIQFVWQCLRPEQRRPLCDDNYNYELWGPQFTRMIQHFKDPNRQSSGAIEDLYRAYGLNEGSPKLSEIVRRIYSLVSELERIAPGRKFTPDGHMVGSLGEVWAAHAYDLTLLPNSTAVHDALDRNGCRVQVKTTQGESVSTYDEQPEHLLVLRLLHDGTAEEWFNGPGHIAWQVLGKRAKNGQCRLSLSKLRALMAEVPEGSRIPRVRK